IRIPSPPIPRPSGRGNSPRRKEAHDPCGFFLYTTGKLAGRTPGTYRRQAGPPSIAHPRMGQKLILTDQNVKNSFLDGGSSAGWMGGGGVSGRTGPGKRTSSLPSARPNPRALFTGPD